MTEFKEALTALALWDAYQNDMRPETRNDFLRAFHKSAKNFRRALLIADRLMQEPSEIMNNHGWAAHVSFARTEPPHMASFKAMRDQLIKEIEQGSKCRHEGYSFNEHGR